MAFDPSTLQAPGLTGVVLAVLLGIQEWFRYNTDKKSGKVTPTRVKRLEKRIDDLEYAMGDVLGEYAQEDAGDQRRVSVRLEKLEAHDRRSKL